MRIDHGTRIGNKEDHMLNHLAEGLTRREFLSAAALAGTGLLGLRSELTAAEPPPETTTIRIVQVSSTVHDEETA